MLSPIALGCRTKTPKVIGIAITALQRVVALRGIPTVGLLACSCTDKQSSLPSVLQTLNSVSNQGADIQLKILQALLSILTYNSDAHGEIMGNVGELRGVNAHFRLYCSASSYKMLEYRSYLLLPLQHYDKQ